jgi:hypothetical protein
MDIKPSLQLWKVFNRGLHYPHLLWAGCCSGLGFLDLDQSECRDFRKSRVAAKHEKVPIFTHGVKAAPV